MQETNVLLVDDDRYELQFVARYLRLAHLVVECAGSGPEALRALEGTRPDAIVADAEMPGMSGAELCRAVRDRAHEDVPFLIYAPAGGEAQRLEGLKAGADDVLLMSAQPEELLLKLRLLIGRRRRLEFFRQVAESRRPLGIMSGHLTELPVPNLLQVIALLELPAACVRLQSAGRDAGEIWMERDRIRHARVSDRSGKTAIRSMLDWSDGTFRVTHERWEGESTVSDSVEACLLGDLVSLDQARLEHPRHDRRSEDTEVAFAESLWDPPDLSTVDFQDARLAV